MSIGLTPSELEGIISVDAYLLFKIGVGFASGS